jgi:hypothetical protein
MVALNAATVGGDSRHCHLPKFGELMGFSILRGNRYCKSCKVWVNSGVSESMDCMDISPIIQSIRTGAVVQILEVKEL